MSTASPHPTQAKDARAFAVEKPAHAANIPGHIAIIMDGNGRWARRRGLSRLHGHEEGAHSLREVIRACGKRGVRELTLYAFSTENWQRPKMEVQFLMRLLRRYLIGERRELQDNNVRLKAIGRIDELPAGVQNTLSESIALTAANTGLIVRLALNYGGKAEIVDAMKRVAQAVKRGIIAPDQIDDDVIREYSYDPEMTDPDLLIRTGGEMRLSNFLLWRLSYAELYITPICWPDFREPQLDEALAAYASRERRFGGLPGGPARETPKPLSPLHRAL
jgi:undecaprenyl diphosphate synthase